MIGKDILDGKAGRVLKKVTWPRDARPGKERPMAGIRLYRWLSTRPASRASAGHSHAGLDRDVGGPAAAKHARRHLAAQAPQAMLRHDVVDISGYQENVIERIRQLQPARLEIPWIISFGEPFAIRIGEASRPAIMGGSFVAGLVAGPALIESGAGAHASASASRRPARAGSSICRCPRSRAAWSGRGPARERGRGVARAVGRRTGLGAAP